MACFSGVTSPSAADGFIDDHSSSVFSVSSASDDPFQANFNLHSSFFVDEDFEGKDFRSLQQKDVHIPLFSPPSFDACDSLPNAELIFSLGWLVYKRLCFLRWREESPEDSLNDYVLANISYRIFFCLC